MAPEQGLRVGGRVAPAEMGWRQGSWETGSVSSSLRHVGSGVGMKGEGYERELGLELDDGKLYGQLVHLCSRF